MRKDQANTTSRQTEDGTKLWQIVTKDVTPLEKNVPARPGAKQTQLKKKIVVAAKAIPDFVPPIAPPKPKTSSDKTLENRLRKGASEIEGKIDLHGNTLNEAHKRLTSFIRRSYGSGKRYLLVITGKGRNGGGAIRNEFRLWLETEEMRKFIFSVSEAELRHGGTGAFYVILRKSKAF